MDTTSSTTRASAMIWRKGLRGNGGDAAPHGLGVVVDVVPNHMAMPVPEHLNGRLWSVLRDGRASRDASGRHRLGCPGPTNPASGARTGDCIDRGELVVDGSTLRYHDHEFPLARDRTPLPDARRRSTTVCSLACGHGGAELPTLLRRHVPDRRPGRGAGSLRCDPRGAARIGRRRPRGRPSHRPPGRPARPPRTSRHWTSVPRVLLVVEKISSTTNSFPPSGNVPERLARRAAPDRRALRRSRWAGLR